jgi:hypothetical protein
MYNSIKQSIDYFDGLMWDHVIWTESYEKVRRVQRRIFRASYSGDKGKIWLLQRWLLKNPSAKLISIYVVSSLLRRWSHILNSLLLSSEDKIILAKSLGLDESLEAKSLSKRNPTRKQSLLFLQDKANQILCTLVLDPEWKVKLGKHSIRFQGKNSAHDVIHAVALSLHTYQNSYVSLIELGDFFNTFDHRSLLHKLNTFPSMEKQVLRWLQMRICHLDKKKFSSDVDLPSSLLQDPLSSLLRDISVYGFEEFLSKTSATWKSLERSKHLICSSKFSSDSLRCLQYSDHILIMGQKKDLVELACQNLNSWLLKMSIEVKDYSTKIKSIDQGITILGFQIIRIQCYSKSKILVKPSKDSIKSILARTRSIIQGSKAKSSYDLVVSLTLATMKWASYFRYSCCRDTFSKVDSVIYQQLRAWVFRRDPKHGRSFIKQVYFPEGKVYLFQGKSYSSNWILNGVKNATVKRTSITELRTNFLPRVAWVTSKRWVRVCQDSSMYN